MHENFWRYVASFFTFKNEFDIFVNWITSLSYSFGIDIISKNYSCISLYSSMGFYYGLTITFRKSSFVCLCPIILFGRPLILISTSHISPTSLLYSIIMPDWEKGKGKDVKPKFGLLKYLIDHCAIWLISCPPKITEVFFTLYENTVSSTGVVFL